MHDVVRGSSNASRSQLLSFPFLACPAVAVSHPAANMLRTENRLLASSLPTALHFFLNAYLPAAHSSKLHRRFLSSLRRAVGAFTLRGLKLSREKMPRKHHEGCFRLLKLRSFTSLLSL